MLDKHPSHESKVDALVATISPHLFGVDKGYGYNPQARDSNENQDELGKIYFMIDYNNVAVLIIENKTDVKFAHS